RHRQPQHQPPRHPDHRHSPGFAHRTSSGNVFTPTRWSRNASNAALLGAFTDHFVVNFPPLTSSFLSSDPYSVPSSTQPSVSSSVFPQWNRIFDRPGTPVISYVQPNFGDSTRWQMYTPAGMHDSFG